MSLNNQYFATCAKGLEELLVDELTQIGIKQIKQTRAGVHFEGELRQAYEVCLWSRLANHVLLPIGEFEAENPDALYQAIQRIQWLDHMHADGSFKIDVNGQHSSINNTQFIAQKIKDAVVDQIRDKTQQRPNIKMDQPDCVLYVYVNKNAFSVHLSLSGESLHKRGYRIDHGRAPLRETLAAAIVMRAGWLEKLKQDAPIFYDPMCGSGTLLIEAAMMAYDRAPGLERAYYGFYGWKGHQEALWSEIEEEAEQRFRTALDCEHITIYGGDASYKAIEVARANIERAGFSSHIQLKHEKAEGVVNESGIEQGLMVFNPPYGERLNHGQEAELKEMFAAVGKQIKAQFDGWELAILTSVPEHMKSIGIRSYKQYKLFNGALPVELLKFHVQKTSFMRYETLKQKFERQFQLLESESSEHQQMFENRLKKNLKHLRKWAKREGIECYRVYDADLPDFAMAIDVYGEHVHIQEYEAGKNVDPQKAYRRLVEAYHSTKSVLERSAEQMHIKVRKQQKGASQYVKLSDQQTFHTVEELGAKFYVNFEGYLDTGLFLDHRLMRQHVAQASKQKTVLNLFAYTCTASVHAALHGASVVTSVDMSNTYLDWGKRNFKLNNLDPQKHVFIQADCLQWLAQNRAKSDVIFLDPPTFSNSKRMQDTLDIQRDHVKLIELAMKALKPEGILWFSNNYRRFKLDPRLHETYRCEDISRNCLPEDFKRRPNIHSCWKISF